MKEKFFTLCLFVLSAVAGNAQIIQGTIKSGPLANQVEVWLRPDFTSSSIYIYQIGLPIAFPASVSPQPSSIQVTLDPGFVAAFGNNYSVSVYPKANNTANTENYFSIALVRGGAGASNPQTLTAGSEFKLLTVTFIGGSAAGAQVKLADYQDAGSDGQGNFYTVDGNANYYVSATSTDNFYSSSGQSLAGGSGSAGFAQTVALISLPINLLSFSGYKNGNKNILQWSTADESNNAGFHIQRSLDGSTYTSIGFIPTQAINGNSSTFLKYSYDDINPTGKKQYYRLKQIDLDARAKLSQVVMINSEKPSIVSIGGLYPNPSIGKLNAIIQSPRSDVAELALIDISGKHLFRRTENLGVGSNTILIDVADLPKGSYLLKVTTQNNTNAVTSQFIKQ